MATEVQVELVTTDDGFHVRKRDVNGEIIWTTQVYTRREAAERTAEEECVLNNLKDYEEVDARGQDYESS